MNINNYHELKKKYQALLKENKFLKAKIRELESSLIPHHKTVKTEETLYHDPENAVSCRQSGAAPVINTFNNKPLSQYSRNYEKIALFMSLFKGRTDVYAKKWQNQKGISGYSPVCLNEWVPGICNKPGTKCSKCMNQSYTSLNESVIEKHLRGEFVIIKILCPKAVLVI